MKTSHLELNVSRPFTLCVFSNCGSLCSHLLLEEASLTMAGQINGL